MRFICRVLKGLFDGVVEVLFGGFIWKMGYRYSRCVKGSVRFFQSSNSTCVHI